MRVLGHGDGIKPAGLDLLSSPHATAKCARFDLWHCPGRTHRGGVGVATAAAAGAQAAGTEASARRLA